MTAILKTLTTACYHLAIFLCSKDKSALALFDKYITFSDLCVTFLARIIKRHNSLQAFLLSVQLNDGIMFFRSQIISMECALLSKLGCHKNKSLSVAMLR